MSVVVIRVQLLYLPFNSAIHRMGWDCGRHHVGAGFQMGGVGKRYPASGDDEVSVVDCGRPELSPTC